METIYVLVVSKLRKVPLDLKNFKMNYSAASSGVSKTKTLNASRSGKLTPCPPLAVIKKPFQEILETANIIIQLLNT
jgi:hypothetical protein